MRVLVFALLVAAAAAASSKPESKEPEVKVEILRCCAIATVLAVNEGFSTITRALSSQKNHMKTSNPSAVELCKHFRSSLFVAAVVI
jgi:hypothetical protein